MTRMLYSGLAVLAEPALNLLLARRRAAGREDPARLGERKGIASRPRPAGKLLWVHGASLGEARSILPLIARLRATRPDLHVLVTTGSRSSAEMLAGALDGTRTFHQYVPLDVPRWVRRFLVPFPFGRGAMIWEVVEPPTAKSELDAFTRHVETRLDAMCEQVDRMAGMVPP